jgi:hypothetical protein
MPTMAGLLFAVAIVRYAKGYPWNYSMWATVAALCVSGLLRALETLYAGFGAERLRFTAEAQRARRRNDEAGRTPAQPLPVVNAESSALHSGYDEL